MDGVSGAGAKKVMQNQPNEHSRRPGTPGHPGKHLGQMKRAQSMNPGSANLPLFQQQIAALDNKNVAGGSSVKVQSAQENEVANQQLALDALRSTNDTISDRTQFISQLNAVGTAFF